MALLDQYPNTRMQAQRRMKNERRNLSLERAQMRTEDEQISERERSWLGSLTDERGGREGGGRVASQCNAATWDVAITIWREGERAPTKSARKGETTDAASKKAFATNSRCPPCLARSSNMPGTHRTARRVSSLRILMPLRRNIFDISI